MDRIVLFIKQRRYLVLLLVLAAAGCAMDTGQESEEGSDVGGGTDPNAVAAWWRGLPQIERNQVILDRTARDVDRYVGRNCKQWAQQAVYEASRGVIWLPLTVNGGLGWYWERDPSGRVQGFQTDIRNVQPGWIVQMRIPDGTGGITPHTAIVVGKSAAGIQWVESNYRNRSDPNAVHLRFQTFEDFERQVTRPNGSREFSVYVVGG